MSASQERVVHRGGCHCRRVRFEVDAPADIEALDCNCSICRMTGFLHLIVPAARFRLVSGEDVLTEYTFNTGAAKHRFCSVCGVKAFYVPRSHPDGVDVNVRCLDAGTRGVVAHRAVRRQRPRGRNGRVRAPHERLNDASRR